MKYLIFLSLFLFGCNKKKLEEKIEESKVTWTECAYAVGEHPCDFTLVNSKGKKASLYDYIGKPVLLDMGTTWCYYCNIAAIDMENISKEYKKNDIVIMTILFENSNGEQPNSDDLFSWIEKYGLHGELLIGNRDIIKSESKDGWPISGWPSFFMIDENMKLTGGMAGYHPDSLRLLIETGIKSDTGL